MPEPSLSTVAITLARVEERVKGVEDDLKRIRQPWPSVVSSLAAAAALIITVINL